MENCLISVLPKNNDTSSNFKTEDKILANNILKTKFYNFFKKGQKTLEIFLIGACKANCEYCYLKKHVKELYPLALHNQEKILSNFSLIIDWYIENEFTCPIDIFSAEWITTPLANKIFDILYEKFSNVEKTKLPKDIRIADNMQFLKDEKATADLETNIDRLKSIGIDFLISASVDGKFCDFGRTEVEDDFYNKLNLFLEKHKYYVHPMISSNNVKFWIQNFKWWKENFSPRIWDRIMSLEVRDNTWTDESIQQLIQYCDFLADEKFKYFNYDKKTMLKFVLSLPTPVYGDTEDTPPVSYNVIGLPSVDTCYNNDTTCCSIGNVLVIRAADLVVNPCHRTYYEELKLGEYEIINGKIGDFIPTNPALLALYTNIKRSCFPHCENCKFQGICVGHCHGASYEEYRNLLVPQYEVCKMYRAKLTFLIYKYNILGIWDELDNLTDQEISPMRKTYLKDLINSILYNMEGEKPVC